MADVLASFDLKHPIEIKGQRTSVLEVRRRLCLGDFAEMERSGYVDNGEIQGACLFRVIVYMARQLCGLSQAEAESLDPEDLPDVQDMFRPFLRAGAPETGEP